MHQPYPGNNKEGPWKRPDNQHSQRLALLVAMTVSMAIIIGAWLLVLPYQLQQNQLLSDEELNRWQEVQAEVNSQTEDFRETLEAFNTDTAQQPTEAKMQDSNNDAGHVPPEVVDRLRIKLQELKQESLEVGTAASTEESTDSEINQ